MENNRSISEISIFSQDLIRFLGEKEIGVLIPYEDLSNVIGFDITDSKGRGYLETAKRRLLKDEGMVFETVRGMGIKLLSDEEIAKTTGKSYLKSVRSKGRKAKLKNQSVDYENLTTEAKIDHQCTMSILALMNHVTKRSSINEIKNKVEETTEQISQKETLKMLRKPLMNGDE